MATAIVLHEVKSGEVWANAWRAGAGSRHEMFGKVGVIARTFRDPEDHNITGLILDIPDMDAFQKLLGSAEGKQAMEEDGLKIETMRLLLEFTP